MTPEALLDVLSTLLAQGYEFHAPNGAASVSRRPSPGGPTFLVHKRIVTGNHAGNSMLIGQMDNATAAIEAFLKEADAGLLKPPAGDRE